MPKVSVLMPVYNVKLEYLNAAIDSILSQTFTDFELLIINDASTDPEMERAILAKQDKRIIYHRNEHNLGISRTRNRLLDLAQGEYLAIMDDDDISLPRRLERQVEFLDSHPQAGIIGTWYRTFPNHPDILRQPCTDNATIEERMMEGPEVIHPASMIRRSVLLETGIRYEPEFSPAEDYALWCRLIGKTEFANIPEDLLHYRVHRKNTSIVQKDRVVQGQYKIHAFTRLEHPDIWSRVEATCTHYTRIRLFGLIPLFVIKKRMNRTTWYLFGKIPVMDFKRHLEFQK